MNTDKKREKEISECLLDFASHLKEAIDIGSESNKAPLPKDEQGVDIQTMKNTSDKEQAGETDIAEQLFGKVLSHRERLKPDIKEIVAPFKYNDTVMRVFCSNCGFMHEAKKGLFEYLNKTCNMNTSLKPTRQAYFEVGGCMACETNTGSGVRVVKVSAD